jgi:1,4-alpha-glucan branching enzyme
LKSSGSPLGYLCFVLHAHLPFVRHPEYADPLEERWFHEALTECYLPLLGVLDGWERDQVDYRLTLSLSPTLVAMLCDPLLQERYARRLDKLIELAERETVRTRWLAHENAAAWHYLGRFRECRRRYEEEYRRDLPAALARHAESGRLELLTCNATHAFLPLLQHQTPVVRAQITVGVGEFRRHFGRPPAGFWSAECGYYPGLDALLAEAGLGFFFMDAHGLLGVSRPPSMRAWAPVRCPSGVAVFARDVESSRQVWNARVGYPGDPTYREFYRDIGFDLDHDYIAPYIHESGLRTATGIKYHRVTGPVELGAKEPYDPRAAAERAVHHGDDFVGKLRDQACRAREELGARLTRPPVIVAPYDAELLGHWWYEGPVFLDRIMRRLCAEPELVAPIAPSEYLARHRAVETVHPSFSSWGEGGFAGPWLNPDTQWIYPLLHDAGDRMVRLARRHADTADDALRRALNQMARELMLAQSSDWAFMIRMGQVVEYGRRRTRQHLDAFKELERQASEGNINLEALAALQARHNLFPALEFEVFAGPNRIQRRRVA